MIDDGVPSSTGYRTPGDCLAALRRLRPLRIDETHRTLAHMLDGLLEARPPPGQHLEVLEAARAPLALVQDELARRHASHPLPPAAMNGNLERVVGLWRLMMLSYICIIERAAEQGTLGDERALLAQRTIFYAAQPLMEFFRARRALPQGLWTHLHRCYARAETQGLAAVRVADLLNEQGQGQSVVETYLAALLIDMANPFGRSERELNWICLWAHHFASYCSLNDDAPPSDGVKPTGYGVDLDSDHGLRPLGVLASPSAAVRRLDGSRLAAQIQSVMAQLRRGVRPAVPGLGEDCTVERAARLLVSLYRPWALGAMGRRFRRRQRNGDVALTSDWLAIGFHVQGSLFEQPKYPSTIRSIHNDIALLTFGERVESVRPEAPAQRQRRDAETLGFICEQWQMRDESVGGFRLRRRTTGERLEHRQLVGVRPADGERFLLGLISWLVCREDGTIDLGVSLLTGLPKVVAVRATRAGSRRGSVYQQAFWLPEVPAMKTPASLVLPAGWFQPHAVIELHNGSKQRLRLMQPLTRGANFDQISYEAVNESA